MHYANGRPAKNGDPVVFIPPSGIPIAGVLYNANAGNDFCNGRIAITHPNDPYPNLKEVLHADDVKNIVLSSVADTSKPLEAAPIKESDK